ncbi:MAG: HAD family phosphatase [Sedimentisphaerales bacterium]|nr:HAD family phosphatase [Sedimentisphaerales bacterium]
MERIESVIFDWGGVLIDDPAPQRLRYCADALGACEEDLAEAIARFMPEFQIGAISEDAFWERVCGELNVPTPKSRSLWGDGFAAAYAARPEMFALAAGLQRQGCKTAVLSNTEAPAAEYFDRMGYDMFDVQVFSCVEGIRKPELRIYDVAVEKLGSPPGRTAYIDDDTKYVEAARQAGLNAIVFETVEQVKNALSPCLACGFTSGHDRRHLRKGTDGFQNISQPQ